MIAVAATWAVLAFLGAWIGGQRWHWAAFAFSLTVFVVMVYDR